MAVNYIDTIKDAQGNEYEIHAASDSILGAQIKSSVITAVKLSKSAVTSEKIKDGAVTSAKLASEVISMIQGAGVDTINTFNGTVTIRTGSTDGTIQVATSSEYSNVSVAGLGTAAFSSASSFASAYNYVKTVNGSAPDASGNVDVSGTTQSLSAQDISYGESTVGDALSNLASTKAGLSSPTFTGTPIAPTALPSTSTSQIATTAFVHQVAENSAFSAAAITYSPSDNAWQVTNVKDALDSLNSAQRNVYASQVYLSDGTTTVASALTSQSTAISSATSSISSLASSVSALSSAIANLSASDISDGQSHTVEDWLNDLQSKKADLASPTFTGTPKAPTASSATNTTQIATTAFVQSAATTIALSATEDIKPKTFVYGSTITQSVFEDIGANWRFARVAEQSGTTDTYAPIINYTNDEGGQYMVFATMWGSSAIKTYTWDDHLSSPSWVSSVYSFATPAYVTSAISTKANTASPTFTGTPKAPTATAGTSTTQIATTAFVQQAVPKSIVQGVLLSSTSALTSSSADTFVYAPIGMTSSSAYVRTCYSVGSKIYPITLGDGAGGIQVLASGIYNVRGMLYCEGHSSAHTGVYLYAGNCTPDLLTNTMELGGYWDINTDTIRKTFEVTASLSAGDVVYMKGRVKKSKLGTDSYYFDTGALTVQEVNAGSATWTPGRIIIGGGGSGGGDDPNPTI